MAKNENNIELELPEPFHVFQNINTKILINARNPNI
jgi:hypothetical protein